MASGTHSFTMLQNHVLFYKYIPLTLNYDKGLMSQLHVVYLEISSKREVPSPARRAGVVAATSVLGSTP